jgi:hypothetical protein
MSRFFDENRAGRQINILESGAAYGVNVVWGNFFIAASGKNSGRNKRSNKRNRSLRFRMNEMVNAPADFLAIRFMGFSIAPDSNAFRDHRQTPFRQ